MRKVQKEQAEDFVKLLGQAHDEIRKCIEENQVEAAASVWKAADADPDCDAYVIPISYYDRKPDGTFGERHYEGNQYPSYVPVTDYEEYDFGKRRMGIILLHNPYDNYNFVTSVHPFFYSEKLSGGNVLKDGETLIKVNNRIFVAGSGSENSK